jgi:hypothetical protein
MNNELCGSIRELIPDLVADRLGDSDVELVTEHLSGCDDCRDEHELAQMVFAGRAVPPEGLGVRVIEAVRRDQRVVVRPWWGVSAAAVAALALGIGIASEPSATTVDVPDFAYEVEEGEVWLSDDGLLAGSPTFDALSDEALLQLLDELAVGGGTGGTA